MYISINNLYFKYDKEDILKDFNLEIKRGEIIAILGKSGSGKSTLLRILSGFEQPYKGSILIDDKVLIDDKTNVPTEKRNIGMLFQDYALFPHLTVEKNIEFGLKKKNKSEKVKEMLELVEMEGFGKRFPHELSGGQQQRIALARSLAPSPNLILLDEPFSNLDTELKEHIREHLKSIIKKSNTTAIFVTHDFADTSIADKIIYLENGKIIEKK
ncbi:MAG: ABC transporter ATP-binding protein [Fusobacterium sp. JB021]|nr:ABC transporter ATP-binding protein [Fusobacterium sp. JB020]MDP0493590.1 ABC transporter ATP-binding protein [Fusobacterium sp. JB021]MDP0505955.1 ABC transporter ATP-binding protein [Fusobacterium sp. JB019]